jgi:hypothetical protein
MKKQNYKVGDTVKLVSKRPSTWNAKGLMDKFLGQVVKIKSINGSIFTFKGGESWHFLTSHIEGLAADKQTNSIKRLAEVQNATDKLLKVNGRVTTLEIKVALRAEYPKLTWNQNEISDIMDQFAKQGLYNYTDNGTYRIYTSVTAPKVTKVTTPKVTSSKGSKISKSSALNMIQSSNGKFFGVTFTKKDGSIRKMTCRIDKDKLTPNNLGYLTVNEVKTKTYKSLNLQTLSELRINKNVYKIN